MSGIFNAILAKPWAAIGVLMVAGAVLVVAGLGTPGAALIGLAGTLIMYASGGGAAAEPPTET